MASISKTVLIAQIKENPAALRGCNKETEEYKGLRDSIRDHGLMNGICLRELPSTDGQVAYGLVDGLQRLTAHIELGKAEIEAIITTLDEAAAVEAQIIANAHKVQTKPVEYCKALIRILMSNPAMTQIDLAAKLNKSSSWISQMMGLTKLDEGVAKLVDGGQINLSNAFALAKLPKVEQKSYVVDAQTDGAEQFLTKCVERAKAIKAANRSGSDAGPKTFVAHAHLRKLAEIQGEITTSQIADKLCKEVGVKHPKEAFILGLQWVLNIDPMALKVAKADWDVKQQKDAADKAAKSAKIAAEREIAAKKAAEDVQVAAKASGIDVNKLLADARIEAAKPKAAPAPKVG